MGALAADGRHLGGRRRDEERPVPVQIRLALVPVVRVLLRDPVRALDVLDELEGAGAHHVGLVPAHVPGEDVRLEDPAERRGEVHEEGGLGPLEPEAHRLRIGRLDGLDRLVGALAERDHRARREDDLVVGGLDVARRHRAPVVEADALAQLEGVGQPVRRDRPGVGQVRNGTRPRPVGGIDAQQRVVVRRQRMDGAERPLAVAVIGRGLGGHHDDQLASVAGGVLGAGGAEPEHHERGGEQHPEHRENTGGRLDGSHAVPPGFGERRSSLAAGSSTRIREMDGTTLSGSAGFVNPNTECGSRGRIYHSRPGWDILPLTSPPYPRRLAHERL